MREGDINRFGGWRAGRGEVIDARVWVVGGSGAILERSRWNFVS